MNNEEPVTAPHPTAAPGPVPSATQELPDPPRRQRVPSWAAAGPEEPETAQKAQKAAEHDKAHDKADDKAHDNAAESEKAAEAGGAEEPDGSRDAHQVAPDEPAVQGSGAGTGPADGGIPIQGFVRNAEKVPVPGALVTLISLAGRQFGRSVAHLDGGYRVAAPGAGSYVLIASADGYQPQAATVVVDETPVAYDVLLSGTSGVSGSVRAADHGGPVTGAVVVVTDVRGDVLASGSTDAQGVFGFGGLVPGYVTVAINAEGYRPQAVAVEIGAAGMTRVDVVLGHGARIRGTIRSAGGPLADARVTLVDAAGNAVASATTGADGEYGFADLDEGEYTVIAGGYPPVASGVWVTGPGVEAHDLVLAHPVE